MSIPATDRRAGPFTGTGSTSTWPFTFKVFSTGDIAVVVADTDAVETTLTLGSDYTVTLNADQDATPGGTVNYLLPDSYVLSIIGDVDYDQPLDLPSGGNFSPNAIERQLDRMVMQIQQLREVVNRSVRAPVSTGASGYLPVPSASTLIGWDGSGGELTNYPLAEIATAIAFASYQYDTFTGNGVQTSFPLSGDPVTLGNIDVSVDGQTYVPGSDHTLSGTALIFTSAPPNGSQILARYGQGILTADVAQLESDLASTATGKGASKIGVNDAAARFTGTTVETALTEVARLSGDTITLAGDATNPLEAVPLQQVEALAVASFSFSGLSLSAAGSSASVAVAANELLLRNASGRQWLASSVSLSVNSAGSGANGLDTGTLAGSTWYAVWVISNGTTVAGLLSLSSTAPTMPSGYTFKARVGWIRTDGSANKYPMAFAQSGRRVTYIVGAGTNVTAMPAIDSGAGVGVGNVGAPTWAAVAVGHVVPPGVKRIELSVSVPVTGVGQSMVAPNNSYGAYNSSTNPPPIVLTVNNTVSAVRAALELESTNIYWAHSGNFYLRCCGWEDDL